MTELLIEETFPKELTSPVLVQFQTGYVNEDLSSTENCLLLENESKNCRSTALCIDDTTYMGDEEEDPFERTMILARNKRTGKIRLIEVGTCLVRAMVDEENAKPVTIQNDVSALDVSRKFGSKRDKKRMEQKERLNVTTAVVTEQMRTIEEADTTVQLDVSAYNKTNTDDVYMPPINREASDVSDVYSVNNLLTEDQVEAIKNEIDSKEYTEELTPYMKNFIASNFISKNKQLSSTEIGLVLYVNSLLKIYAESAKEIVRKNYRVCLCSITIHEIILNNFTLLTNGKRTRPIQMKDKALCYALIILLILNNFKIQLEQFASAVKLSPPSVMNKARIIGASAVTTTGQRFIQLKLPLSAARVVNRRKSSKF